MHRSSGKWISQAASVIRPCSDAEEMGHTVGGSPRHSRCSACPPIHVCAQLKRLHGAFRGVSDVALHVKSLLHQGASATLSHSANPIYLARDEAERPSWDCHNPCGHKGELKGKALHSALRSRGGGGEGVLQ